MQQDYKYLQQARRPRGAMAGPRRWHWLLAAVALLTITLVVGGFSRHADANRQQEMLHETLILTDQTAPLQENASALADLPDHAPIAVDSVDILPEDAQTQATDTIVSQPMADHQWLEATVQRGDSLARIFKRHQLSASELHQIMQSGSVVERLKRVHPGQVLRLRIDSERSIHELVYEISRVHSIKVARSSEGYEAQSITRPLEIRTAYASGEIDNSLFVDGQKAGLSDNLIMQLAGIFGWDIDMALDLRPGDRFTVIYEEQFLDGEKVGDGNILAAEFINRGDAHRAVRYVQDGQDMGYYSPEGHSMRKAFLRSPVEFSRISSRFNLRRKHPVLNRIRAHKGVDYAAPRGTPVRATGDGKIIFRGTKGGYGKTVIIRHGSRYSTLYAHLNSYHRKLRNGSRVKQGQIIGFVGSTGLATGPHLHYEFRRDGVHRNPLTVKLPQSAPLAKKYLQDFKDSAAPLLAQLDLLNRTRLALQGEQ